MNALERSRSSPIFKLIADEAQDHRANPHGMGLKFTR